MSDTRKKIEELTPPKLGTLLDVYMRIKKRQAKERDIRIPIITVFLHDNFQLHGRILSCDFVSGRVAFLVTTTEGSLDVSFLDMDRISSITLHDLDLCDEFIQELQSRE